MTDRLPPQDLDAERALLGSMMMSASVIHEVADIVTRDSFYLGAHQPLFKILVDAHAAGHPMDLLKITDELRKRDLLESIGGQDYMILLAESFAEWANAPHYARIVEDHARRRRLIGLGLELSAAGYDLSREPEEMSESFAKRVEEVGLAGGDESSVDCEDLLTELGDRLAEQGDSVGYLESPFSDLNRYYGGIELSALTIVGARTSQGKTAFSLNLAVHCAQRGVPALFISVEMDRWRIGERVVSIASGRSIAEAKRNASPDELKELTEYAKAWIGGRKRLYIVDGKSVVRIRDIVSIARAHVRRHGVKLIVVDYLQLIRPAERLSNRYQEVGDIARRLKELATVTGAAVVAPSQLGRDAEGRRPKLSDLRESGNIEQDADVVILLWADKRDSNDTRTVVVDVSKNRHGATGYFRASFNLPTQRFGDEE